MKTRRICLVALVLIVSLLFTACADLGYFKDEEDYYSAFDSFKLITCDTLGGAEIKSCGIGEIYNKDTSENFTTPFSPDEYRYATITVKKDLLCDGIALWFKTTVSTCIKVELFLINSFNESEFLDDCFADSTRGQYTLNPIKGENPPEQLTGRTSLTFDGKGKVSDQDKNTAFYDISDDGIISWTFTKIGVTSITKTEYVGTFSEDMNTLNLSATVNNNPDSATAVTYTFVQGTDTLPCEVGLVSIGTTQVTLIPNSWNSVMMEEFTVYGERVSSLEIKEGQNILVKILNNAPSAHRYGINPVAFTVTNFMVRSLDPTS